MDYRKTAQEILGYVGGSKNIVSAAHCATRLRLVIADNSKADKEAIENVDGVKGVFEASGQLQIILGTGTVNKVFDEFIAIAGITASTKAEAKEAAAEKQNWFMKAIKLLGDIFVPIIPAIVASGFLMGIMNALDFMNANGFLAIDTSSSIYVFANLFSNIAYTFLQILIAFSAAKAFGKLISFDTNAYRNRCFCGIKLYRFFTCKLAADCIKLKIISLINNHSISLDIKLSTYLRERINIIIH